jgi:hypothetical protein
MRRLWLGVRHKVRTLALCNRSRINRDPTYRAKLVFLVDLKFLRLGEGTG